MVMHRQLDYGCNAYQVPVVPRASRSARGRGPCRKKRGENQIQAFEILASVAGKILRETESSAPNSPTYGKDQHNIVSNVVKGEVCDEKMSASVAGLRGHHQNLSLNEVVNSQDNFSSGFGLTSKNFDDQPKRICFAENVTSSSKVLGDLFREGKCFHEVEGVNERKVEANLSKIRTIKNETSPVSSSSRDFMELDKKPSIDPENGTKASSLRGSEALSPFPRRCVNMNMVSRDDDDDENFVDVKEQKMNQQLASKDCRVGRSFKAGGCFRTDAKTKPLYHHGRPSYLHEKSERIVPFKKRKYYHESSLSNSDDDDLSAVIGASSSIAGQQASPESNNNCNVKLSIKSFKVPELFIEIPATATVGSLKRTVMEAVTAILGDGLHVGILLQGKKVRDDNKTLLQTGISQDDKLHSLGFMLEPTHGQIFPPPCTKDTPLLSSSHPRGITRHSLSWNSQHGTSGFSSKSLSKSSGSCTDCDRDEAPSCAGTPNHKNAMIESRALVAVPAVSMRALTVVPYNRKSGHPEFVQRRIRRPFSVSEVEALVQAVEKLGTGRWRDVKMRAFDTAKHRTYVDLKDKWKTLVHTARISPQQRRGEPVPQELLDRVLAAHAYWSQQQARQVKSAV